MIVSFSFFPPAYASRCPGHKNLLFCPVDDSAVKQEIVAAYRGQRWAAITNAGMMPHMAVEHSYEIVFEREQVPQPIMCEMSQPSRDHTRAKSV